MELICLVGIIAIGIILIVSGIDNKNKTSSKEKYCTLKTIGEVVEVIQEYSSDDGTLYFPVVKYSINNLDFIQKIDDAHIVQKYAVGNCIDIYVNPSNAEDICTKPQLESNKIMSNFLIIFGILTLVCGVTSVGIYLVNNIILKIIINWMSML